MIQVLLASPSRLDFDGRHLVAAARAVLEHEGVESGEVSLTIVDDAAMRRLHRRWLGSDRPTDVISFPLERSGGRLEGEVVVSAQTACRQASRYGWTPQDELLLYVVHGLLHLVGYDDRSPAERVAMRAKERFYLGRQGRQVRYRAARPKPRTRRSARAASKPRKERLG